MTIAIALFEPDIPQNTGTILRLVDCLNLKLHIIEPCGFIFGGSHMRRASMDYLQTADYLRHRSWEDFLEFVKSNSSRLVIATTKTDTEYYDFTFQKNDILLFGKESQGLPKHIHDFIDKKITIKMRPEKRSLNLAVSCAMLVSEALRQLREI